MNKDATFRGFLREEFRLFHLKDKLKENVDFHYHDFDKIVIFLSDNAGYIVEGRRYYLKPQDILFVRHGQIHKPLVDPGINYERIVIWINSEYLSKKSTEEFDLSACFCSPEEQNIALFSPDPEQCLCVMKLINELEHQLRSRDSGGKISAECIFLQLMVELNRFLTTGHISEVRFKSDKKIEQLLQYINANLNEDLSIQSLADKFYISRYYFMRRFKEVTGYTVHNYIIQKRLIHAAESIALGIPPAQSASGSGFSDYSVFLRAFRKTFGMSPREFAKRKTNVDRFNEFGKGSESNMDVVF